MQRLHNHLERGWGATLLARDGAVLADVRRQAERIPPEATHVIINAGRNDALREAGVFGESVASIGEALARLAGIRKQFRRNYREMLETVLPLGLPTAVCTIYDARFPDPKSREVANTALTLLNDEITRAAAIGGIPVVDLRVLCDEASDFANAIEPSVQGGEKIARAILELAAHHDFSCRRSSLFAGSQRE